MSVACPPLAPIMDDRAAACYLHTIKEAAKYADCRSYYTELAVRQKILLSLLAENAGPGGKGINWKFWKRGD